jgi:hypothetical protein
MSKWVTVESKIVSSREILEIAGLDKKQIENLLKLQQELSTRNFIQPDAFLDAIIKSYHQKHIFHATEA